MQGIGADRRKRVIIEILFVLFIGVLIFVDQITKWYVSSNFKLNSTKVDVIENFFYFTYTVNTGAAWSFLADKNWGQTFLKIMTAVALILFIVYYVYVAKKGGSWHRISISLIIGGTLGNFIDRLLYDHVVDFIGFTFGNYNFPVFNLADSFLVVGVIMLLVYYLFLDKNAIFKKKNAEKDV